MNAKLYTVKINAGNDTNGNPRRGWHYYDATGAYVGFQDEGYRYSNPPAVADCKPTELGSFQVTPSEYREACKRPIVSTAPGGGEFVTTGAAPIFGIADFYATETPAPAFGDRGTHDHRAVKITAKQAAARIRKNKPVMVYGYAEGRSNQGQVECGCHTWYAAIV